MAPSAKSTRFVIAIVDYDGLATFDVSTQQAKHKLNGQLAAAKICEIKDEDLEDFVVEIDILSEIKHSNIVELLEAYVFNDKLWVFIVFAFAFCL